MIADREKFDELNKELQLDLDKASLNTINAKDLSTKINGYVLFEEEKFENSLNDYLMADANKASHLVFSSPSSGTFSLTPLTIEQKIDISKQLIVKMNTYHEAGYVHRSITPLNLFIKENGDKRVLFIVQGRQSAMHTDPSSMRNRSSSIEGDYGGQFPYWSPEFAQYEINTQKKIDMHKVDAWGVGMCLLTLFNYTEFKEKDTKEMLLCRKIIFK